MKVLKLTRLISIRGQKPKGKAKEAAHSDRRKPQADATLSVSDTTPKTKGG